MDLSATAILIFIVMDPFGNIPFINVLLRDLDAGDFRRTVARELLFALIILTVFLLFGTRLLGLMHISQESIGISGGVVLLMIGIKMIFLGSEHIFETNREAGIFIVPIATPSIAGPSAIATVMLVASRGQVPVWHQWLALLLAWLAVAAVLLGSQNVAHYLGRRGLAAMDRLMGLLLVAISVEMLKNAVLAIVRSA
ncbi:MAG: MarC family protein [Planctomycetota bacterium]